MIWSDYVALAVILLMSLRVGIKGFVMEFSSKSGALTGFLACFFFYTPFSLFFASRFSLDAQKALALSLIVLFSSGYVSARYLLAVLDEIFVVLHLRVFDHILGFALGAVEGACICAGVIFLMGIQSVVDLSGVYHASVVVQKLSPVIPIIVQTVREVVK